MFLLICSTSSINIYSPSDRSTDVQIKTYCYSRLLKSYSVLLRRCPKMGRWEVITDNCKKVMQYNAIKSLFIKSPFCKKIFIWTNGYLPNTNYRVAYSWKDRDLPLKQEISNSKVSNFSIFPTTHIPNYPIFPYFRLINWFENLRWAGIDRLCGWTRSASKL